MAYKYQPIKDEMFGSDDEGGEAREENGENGDAVEAENGTAEGETILGSVDEAVAQLPPNSKVKQVIEQDGVLILETVEADPNDPDGLPVGAAILADGDETLGNSTMNSTMGTDDSSMDDSAILAELEEANNVEMKPSVGGAKESCHICGKKVAALDKHILSEHGEKVECQLCNQTFPVGNLRWHILKEHCHNKVNSQWCSCEVEILTFCCSGH